jgi:hypothetical protein
MFSVYWINSSFDENCEKEVWLMQIESCRDCLNLDDRRDIDRVALCAMHHGPSVCCAEFQPKHEISATDGTTYERFCVNCTNFDEVEGIPLCARDHRPGLACGAFKKAE